MDAVCEYCGTPFKAKRSTAKYCSSSHRAQAHQARGRPGGDVVVLRPAPEREPEDLQTEPMPTFAGPGPVEAAATKELRDAGKIDTTLGQTAVVMARRVDENAGDTGSALAGLVREMRSTLDAALAGARPADELDGIRRRRARKMGGA